MTSIGQGAFQASGLTSLDLTNTKITQISDNTFNGAANLATVKLPVGVTQIGQRAFQGTTNLEKLIQGSATSTGTPQVKEGSNELTNTINNINQGALHGSGIQSINLTNVSITSNLGNSIFQEATSLTTLTLPDGLVEIPAGMVAGATALKSLNIPSTVTTINGGNFEFPGAFAGSGIEGTIDLSTATGLAT